MADDEATVKDIVNEAKAAAGQFDSPIKIGAAVPKPSKALTDSLIAMANKQTDIHEAAEQEILESPALNAALAALRSATGKLTTTAAIMTNATAIVTQASTFVGYGTDAVKAINSVTKKS